MLTLKLSVDWFFDGSLEAAFFVADLDDFLFLGLAKVSSAGGV